jgi:serine/threonine protein kinase
MKVVDKDAVALKKKSHRAEMERKIIKMLDHPFLPSLYAEFEASHYSCIVMEYCSGGDLHSLRHRHHRNRFSLSSAR